MLDGYRLSVSFSGEKVREITYSLRCNDCQASIDSYTTKHEAIERWNTRSHEHKTPQGAHDDHA